MNKKITAGILGGLALAGGGTIVADQQINPFEDKIDRVEMVTVADVPDAGEQKVELKKDKPEVRFKKWNGEVDLGLTYDAVKANGNRPLLSNKMEYKDTDQEVHAYPLTDAFEIEVILKEKPKTNVVTFTLDNYQNLDFFYQPALTQQEIDEGASRPENVIGSYAVYAKEKANHIIGQTNYGTGKIGHIFRPKIIDSAGTGVWGELHIENGLLSVTIPQSFLDTGIYPIIVDPTFGYTTQGTSGSSGIANIIAGSVFTSTEAGTVTQMTAYMANTASPDGDQAGQLLAIYTTGYSLITNGGTTAAVIAGTNWKTFTFAVNPTISATNYVLVAHSQAQLANQELLYFDAGSANQGLTDANTYTGSALSSFASPTLNNNKYSIYATYTASGGAVPNNDIIMFE